MSNLTEDHGRLLALVAEQRQEIMSVMSSQLTALTDAACHKASEETDEHGFALVTQKKRRMSSSTPKTAPGPRPAMPIAVTRPVAASTPIATSKRISKPTSVLHGRSTYAV